jgi:hypothetical protein
VEDNNNIDIGPIVPMLIKVSFVNIKDDGGFYGRAFQERDTIAVFYSEGKSHQTAF